MSRYSYRFRIFAVWTDTGDRVWVFARDATEACHQATLHFLPRTNRTSIKLAYTDRTGDFLHHEDIGVVRLSRYALMTAEEPGAMMFLEGKGWEPALPDCDPEDEEEDEGAPQSD